MLPQMRMPRAMGQGGVAGRTARAVYASAGQPQCTLHGTAAWNTADTMSVWLRELKQRLNRAVPGRPVLLVMDACTVHMCSSVLRKCRQLGIAVVIIPSRMTWLLQPLDTHVFARLKTDIRKRSFEAIARSDATGLAPCKSIALQGVAIRHILVEQDWSAVVARSGLAGPDHELRGLLQQYLRGADLAPRRPTQAELCECMNVTPERATALRLSLAATLEAACGVADAGAAAEAAEAAVAEAAPPAAPARVVQVPTLRLRRDARLPAAVPRRELAPNFIMERPARERPVTRSMSAASLATETVVPAAPAAIPPAAPLLAVRLRRL